VEFSAEPTGVLPATETFAVGLGLARVPAAALLAPRATGALPLAGAAFAFAGAFPAAALALAAALGLAEAALVRAGRPSAPAG